MASSKIQTVNNSATGTFGNAVPVSLSVDTYFRTNTHDNNGLICCVFGRVFYSPIYSQGYSASIVAPVTAGVAWTLIDQITFGEVAPTGPPDPGEGQYIYTLAIYYTQSASALSSSTPTHVQFSASAVMSATPGAAAYAALAVGLMEVSSLGAAGTAISNSISNQYYAAALAGTSPVFTTISAGTIGVSDAGDLVIVLGAGLGIGHDAQSITPPPGFFGSIPAWQVASAAGSVSTAYTSTDVDWGVIAVSFGPGVVVGGAGQSGCGTCADVAILETIPGFSDLPNSVLSAEDASFALHLGEISMNGAFGMVRCEIFPCLLKHGDTVPLPVSCADGYAYSRNELLYVWTVQSTLDPSTNWISGPDSLWFANWKVDQVTGEVFSEEWYERSSSADSRLAAKSNDGLLMVYTVAQRQKTNMIMTAPASYVAIDETKIAVDKPYAETLLKNLNDNAKFGSVGTEIFYLGEYIDGSVVTLPTSPVDGHVYTAAECKFMHAWRWTAKGSAYTQPPGSDEQAAPFQAAIDESGNVSITVSFSTDGGNAIITETGYGRIAAFAFCRRTGGPGTLALSNAFTEIPVESFFPGKAVRASTLLTIKRNIDEAILTPEFFGPTNHVDGDTIATPISPIDGYVYSRDELQYVWAWKDTKNNLGGTHDRLPFFIGSISQATGKVSLQTWRLPPGGPYVNDGDSGVISVIIMANRHAQHSELVLTTAPTSPADAGTFVTDVATNVYSVGVFIAGSPRTSNQLIIRAVLPDAVTFPAGLGSSSGTAGIAATASSVFTVLKNGVSFGTFTFGASSSTAVIAAATATSFNGTTDVLSIVGPASIDASLADIGIGLRGTR